MGKILGNVEEILSRHVTGFHEYILSEPVHLAYVSKNLCDMTGFTSEELLDDSEDHYADLIHPADREVYSEFIRKLERGDKSASTEYRIVDKERHVTFVSDTATTQKMDDGTMVAYSVLSDITPLKNENYDLRFLNETVPCGFIKYTCDKNPKITYVNERMLSMLRFPKVGEGLRELVEMCSDNIFMLFPPEDRPKMAEYLERASATSKPVVGEISILRCDGTRGRFFGWITKVKNEINVDEFQSVLIDVTKDYQARKATERDRYLAALSDVYDKIFECDFNEQIVTYIHGHQRSPFGRIKGIPMILNDATRQWVYNTIIEEDCERVLSFLQDGFAKRGRSEDGKPLSIKFKAISSYGELKQYAGIFLRVSSSRSLFCIRYDFDANETNALKAQYEALKGNVQSFFRQFSDGMVAFEYENGYVTPLYGNDNAYRFFKYSEEEWKKLYGKPNKVEDFVSRTGLPVEAFYKVLEVGEAEFTYISMFTGLPQRVKAVCSERTGDGTGPRYILLYDIKESPAPKAPLEPHLQKVEREKAGKKVYVRTFGYFDVFVDDEPVVFRSKKSKELMALLVDRRGGFVTAEQIISSLWEDEDVNPVTLARCRKVALRLRNTLDEYGIGDIAVSIDGRRRAVVENFGCDLYEYLSGKPEYANLFKGSYLSDYSWGETTLGELLGDFERGPAAAFFK
ncbi:MAG: PAS domain-containing protein [Clostridia bacterium]|nr:PAS domain-containing protein [Clostridia bacterium]